MSILAEVFEQDGALDRLEGFTSLHGADFYGFPPATATITLTSGEPVAYPAKIEHRRRPGHRLRPRISAALARDRLMFFSADILAEA